MASSNGMQVATLTTIEAALKLVDTKKESLKQSYDDLQAHSSLLSSFSLSWSDLDAHFSSIQNSLTRRFHDLQSLESSSSQINPPPSNDPVDSVVPLHEPSGSDQLLTVNGGEPSPSIRLYNSQTLSREVPVKDPSSSRYASIGDYAARPELVLMCEKRDGRGLRNYFNDHPKERNTIRSELVSLMRVFPDAGTMVLDAMEGFYASNSMSRGDGDTDMNRLRKSCLDLLEVLIESRPVLSDQAKERAKILALEWKEKVSLNGDSPLEALGFLNLIAAYDLGCLFEAGDLLHYFVAIARCKQATELCRALGLGDKINDLVQKLVEGEKRLLAVKFVFEFGLTEKFQPVPLLKDHLNECRKFSKKTYQEGKNSKAMNEARSREINALKAVLKIVDEHKLDAEYPRQELENEIEMLENKAAKKLAVPSPDNKAHQKPKKQAKQQQSKKQKVKRRRLNGNKHSHTPAKTGPATVPGSISGSSSAVHSFQQSHLPPAALSPTAGPHGLMGSTPIASYAGASTGPYSIPGVGMGYTSNLGPAAAHPYSNPYVPTGYDRPAAYGGYVLPPQYHPAYYHQ